MLTKNFESKMLSNWKPVQVLMEVSNVGKFENFLKNLVPHGIAWYHIIKVAYNIS